MNDIPLVKDNSINAINTSLIAAKKNLQLIYGILDNVNKTFKDINKEIDAIDAKFADYLLKDDVVNSITDGDMRPVTSNAVAQISPVDTVASGNLHSVTSNAVFNLNSLSNITISNSDIFTTAESCSADRVTFFRGYECTNSPISPSSNDFYYQVSRLFDSNWIKIIAIDIRSNDVYFTTKINGVWGSWAKIQKIEYALADAPIVDVPFSLSEGSFSNIRIRNGVYHLVGRYFSTTPIAITEGMIIGRLRQDYYINPTWDFVTNVHNFATNEDYILWIYNNGDIRIFGIGNRTIALDFYIGTTYVK